MFDGQFQRTLAKAPWFQSDIGECFAVAKRINDGDAASWLREWEAEAQRLRAIGDETLARGHRRSAREYYLRAGEYHRQAYFFHRDDNGSDDLLRNYRAQRDCFRAAAALFDFPVEALDVPFEGTTMTGYFFARDASGEERPTIVMPGGYDGTAEEAWSTAVAALVRGFNVFAFDGPGQGGTLYEQGLVMRPDYEVVLPPVVDVLLERPDVDRQRLALLGRSFGGYLAPRAATGEHRFAALIADPGQHDMGHAMRQRFGAEMFEGLYDDSPDVEQQWQSLLDIPNVKRLLAPRMATHGCDTVRGYVRSMLEYTLDERAAEIRCPSLICDNEVDPVSTGQGKELFDLLRCPKTFVEFTVAEGAGGHCEGLAPNLFFERAFDWLADTLSGS